MPSSNLWLGGATSPVAQVDTLTVGGTVEIGDIFNVFMTDENGTLHTLSWAATTTSTTTTATEIAAAFNASTDAAFTPVTASAVGAVVTLTADVAGVPFSVAVNTTETGGGGADAQTFVRAASVANRGPSDFNTAANWLTGIVPVSGDSWDANGRATTDMLYGLGQTAKTFALVRIYTTFTKAIGSLSTRLRMGCTNCVIGEPVAGGSAAGGSSLINIGFHTVAGTARVKGTRSSGTSGYPPVQLLPGENTFDVIVEGGNVGIGTATPGEAVTMNELTIRGGKVEVGDNVSLAGSAPAVHMTAGELLLRSALATINQDAGLIRTEGTGAITDANIGGNFVSNSTGTITNLTVSGGGVADFSQSIAARTVTNATVTGPGARIAADSGKPLVITWTNGVRWVAGATPSQGNMGTEVKTTYAAA